MNASIHAILSTATMGMLPARNYVSETTTFIRDLLKRNPEIVEDQRKGRAIFWDKQPRDLNQVRSMDKGDVPQKGYVYYSLDDPDA